MVLEKTGSQEGKKKILSKVQNSRNLDFCWSFVIMMQLHENPESP